MNDDFKVWVSLCQVRGNKVYDQEAPFRGGTQAFADAGLIDFVRDTGTTTVYRLTEAGQAALEA